MFTERGNVDGSSDCYKSPANMSRGGVDERPSDFWNVPNEGKSITCRGVNGTQIFRKLLEYL